MKRTIRKRLLFAFMAMCVAISGFALETGEFVYTPQGRFQITGASVASSNFTDLTGWTAISSMGNGTDSIFNLITVDSITCVQSKMSTAGEGMYFKFKPTDISASYVVSFKMKGAALDNIRIRIPSDGYKNEDNLVKIAGNETNTYTYPSTDGEVIVNTAEELDEEWQTFYYAILGSALARTYFISFTGMANTILIADLQIAPAAQVADLRQRDAMLEKLNVYKNCYKWETSIYNESGIDEAIGNLLAVNDGFSQSDLDNILSEAKETLDGFINSNMDDYLVANSANYLGINSSTGNQQKLNKMGEWIALPEGRAFWSSGQYPDLGHFAGGNYWCMNYPNSPMGVYMQKTLVPGSYIFSIEGNAAVRENASSSSWTINDGLNVGYGVAYITKVVEGTESPDTIMSVIKNLDAVDFTPFLVSAKITEEAVYEIGFKAYCKDAYKDLKNGSIVYVKDASLWGKNGNVYTQEQLYYEANFRAQIKIGRDSLTKAVEYLANDDYYWGKADLQASVDEFEPFLEDCESMSQDDIISTYDDGLYEEVTYIVENIVAANKKFLAINDTLMSIQLTIDAAETTLNSRVYSAATGKESLLTAIDKAESVLAEMKASHYSEENVAIIKSTVSELSEAIETFKLSLPTTDVTNIVDIDFENEAFPNEDTQLYSISGVQGSMEFSSWSVDGSGNQPFEKGYWSNGERLWSGYIRIGNGTGIVVFDPTINGSMGTNILKVACDFYVQGLKDCSLGFYLKDNADTDVFGIYQNFYDDKTTTNTCEADLSKIWIRSGSKYNDAGPSDASEGETTYSLEKSHIEVIMDYGKRTMYCTINSVNGWTFSKEVTLNAVPTKFILQSNYIYDSRRAWFDNLKIERIAAEGVFSEAYAVLTTDTTSVLSSDSTDVTYGKTLTFYYDNQKDARGGMSVGPFSESDLPAWDAQRASITTTIFDSSFANCTSITSTAYWFFGCVNMTSVVDIGNLKTDNVTDMHSMFWGCSGLTNLDLSKFKTDNVTNMYGMFYGCYSLTTLDLSKFNTTNVTNMSDMFCYCSGLTSLDLSGFNTANVMHTGSMFKFCSELNTIYAGSGWSNEAVTGGGDMFEDCTSLVGGKGTTFDAEHTDATYAHIDGGPSNPGYLTLKLAMGDANGDGYVNIADAVATVTNILGQPTAEEFYQYAADMNNDQVIDIFDVTLIVNAAFDAASPAPVMTRGSSGNIMMEHISMTADADDIYLGIDQPERFTAMQFDVTLPEGVELANVRLTSATTDHQVSFVKLGENEYRVIGLSLINATFRSLDGQLLKLQTSGSAVDSDVKMSNVLFITPSNKTVTGIEAVNSSLSNVQRLTWYDLKGQRVGKQQLGKGIYIMNHKKVVMDNYRQAY